MDAVWYVCAVGNARSHVSQGKKEVYLGSGGTPHFSALYVLRCRLANTQNFCLGCVLACLPANWTPPPPSTAGFSVQVSGSLCSCCVAPAPGSERTAQGETLLATFVTRKDVNASLVPSHTPSSRTCMLLSIRCAPFSYKGE